MDYAAIANCIGDLLWETDADLNLVSVAAGDDLLPEFRKALEASLTFQSWFEVGDEDGVALMGAIQNRERIKNQHLNASLFERRVRVNGAPRFEDGLFQGYSGVLTDITDRVKQARELVEANRQKQLLYEAIEASPINITIVDASHPDRVLLFVNKAFCETTGYERDEVIGRNCRFLQGPDTSQEDIRKIRDAMNARRPIDINLLNYRKNGTPFLNSLSIAPVYDSHRNLIAFLGIQRDVTEEWNARQTELTRSRLESLGRLAGGVAHEINNLMQPCLMYSDLLEDYVPEDSDEAHEFLESIRDNAKAVRGIVQDILTFSRSDEDPLHKQDLIEALDNAVAMVRSMVPGGQQIDFCVAADTDPPEAFLVLIRQKDLHRVIMNLVINAIYAMGMTGTVKLELRLEGDRAVLDISDAGSGIPEDVLPNIFDPFFSTKKVGEGTGLGLSIVHSIITAWGGTISVTKTGPDGTTFRIVLWRSVATQGGDPEREQLFVAG